MNEISSSSRGQNKTEDFVRWNLSRISTGSLAFDCLFGGKGLPIGSVTDIFGAFATGKTQFAFQNAVMTCKHFLDREKSLSNPAVVFVDCGGSFRPERISEIAISRGVNPERVLDLIVCAYVRSVSEQRDVSQRFLIDDRFSKCRLIVIDDVTMNFMAESNETDQVMHRQFLLGSHIRKLSYIASRTGLSVLLTNSIRSRPELGQSETTGEIISQYSLYRLHFNREGKTRTATITQPILLKDKMISFEIATEGIIP